jgi:hypothetical protein
MKENLNCRMVARLRPLVNTGGIAARSQYVDFHLHSVR